MLFSRSLLLSWVPDSHKGSVDTVLLLWLLRLILFPVPCFSLMPTAMGRSRWGSCSRPCRGSWGTSWHPRRSPRWSRRPTLMETAPSTLKVTLCGDRHPYLPRVTVFPSWPFHLILPQFGVGGGRVRFRNCVLPPFLPMSFPKAHASHLSLY